MRKSQHVRACACMPGQAMRFGNDLEACLKAIQIGFELAPRPSEAVYQSAVKTLEMVKTHAIMHLHFWEAPPAGHRQAMLKALR